MDDLPIVTPLIEKLHMYCAFWEIDIEEPGTDYTDVDPLGRTIGILRAIVGSSNEWIGNGDEAHRRLNGALSDVWDLNRTFASESGYGSEEHIPMEHRRKFERIYEMMHHVRDILLRMRRISMLRAPECDYLEQNQQIREAHANKGRHAEFQLNATKWDCLCNAAHGIGHSTEDNSNIHRDRPIGMDDDTVDAIGKHVRWAWDPPPQSSVHLRPFQRFISYLLEQCRLCDYRRYKQSVYRRIETSAGRFTPAWERVGSIESFVRGTVIDRAINFKHWNDATCERGNIHAATDYLENCIDPSFPVLVKTRLLYAFSNGVYVTYIRHNGLVMDYFWRYGDPRGIPIPGASTLAAAKYFDRPCRYGDSDIDWFDIPTPAMSSIMDYQQLDTDVQKWHWALLGRLFHNVGEIDSWQICFFLRGVAQSGKSSVILFWKGFFEAEDVGTIANNIESTFGWGVLSDKLVCLGPELRADFVKNVDQATLQSIISGEIVSLAVKNKDPVNCQWKSPLFLVGNDEFLFKDSSGQIARRFVSIEYLRRVHDVDQSLPLRLDAERDAILVKANRAYLAAVNEVGSGDVWSKFPAYFRNIQRAGFELSNSIAHFLTHGALVSEPDVFMPHKAFQKLYAIHCITYGLTKMPWRRTNYSTVFGAKGLRVSEKAEQKDWHGNLVTDVFIFGIDVIDPSNIDVN